MGNLTISSPKIFSKSGKAEKSIGNRNIIELTKAFHVKTILLIPRLPAAAPDAAVAP